MKVGQVLRLFFHVPFGLFVSGQPSSLYVHSPISFTRYAVHSLGSYP